MHRYRQNEARGDLPLAVYECLHELTETPFEHVAYRWKQCLDAGIEREHDIRWFRDHAI
jgi:hypothetical protein